jgi:hypothetical protein
MEVFRMPYKNIMKTTSLILLALLDSLNGTAPTAAQAKDGKIFKLDKIIEKIQKALQKEYESVPVGDGETPQDPLAWKVQKLSQTFPNIVDASKEDDFDLEEWFEGIELNDPTDSHTHNENINQNATPKSGLVFEMSVNEDGQVTGETRHYRLAHYVKNPRRIKKDFAIKNVRGTNQGVGSYTVDQSSGERIYSNFAVMIEYQDADGNKDEFGSNRKLMLNTDGKAGQLFGLKNIHPNGSVAHFYEYNSADDSYTKKEDVSPIFATLLGNERIGLKDESASEKDLDALPKDMRPTTWLSFDDKAVAFARERGKKEGDEFKYLSWGRNSYTNKRELGAVFFHTADVPFRYRTFGSKLSQSDANAFQAKLDAFNQGEVEKQNARKEAEKEAERKRRANELAVENEETNVAGAIALANEKKAVAKTNAETEVLANGTKFNGYVKTFEDILGKEKAIEKAWGIVFGKDSFDKESAQAFADKVSA